MRVGVSETIHSPPPMMVGRSPTSTRKSRIWDRGGICQFIQIHLMPRDQTPTAELRKVVQGLSDPAICREAVTSLLTHIKTMCSYSLGALTVELAKPLLRIVLRTKDELLHDDCLRCMCALALSDAEGLESLGAEIGDRFCGSMEDFYASIVQRVWALAFMCAFGVIDDLRTEDAVSRLKGLMRGEVAGAPAVRGLALLVASGRLNPEDSELRDIAGFCEGSPAREVREAGNELREVLAELCSGGSREAGDTKRNGAPQRGKLRATYTICGKRWEVRRATDWCVLNAVRAMAGGDFSQVLESAASLVDVLRGEADESWRRGEGDYPVWRSRVCPGQWSPRQRSKGGRDAKKRKRSKEKRMARSLGEGAD